MSQWDLQANETSVYFKNTVNNEVVEAAQKEIYGKLRYDLRIIRCNRKNMSHDTIAPVEFTSPRYMALR